MTRLALAAALAALLPSLSHAALIVDSAVAAPSLAGANAVDATDWLAESFTLGAGATIGSVAVQVLDAGPASDAGRSFVVAVYANANGLPALDFNAPNQGRLYATSLAYAGDGFVGTSGLAWQLGTGSYWLAVEAGNDDGAVTTLALPSGALPAPSSVAFYSGDRSYAATGRSDAFGLRLSTVAAVPESSTSALLGLGLATLAVARRRARR